MMSPKKDLQTSLASVEKKVISTLHTRLSTIHANDANLSKQTKSLQAHTVEARKQQDSWNNIVRAGRNGMKVQSAICKGLPNMQDLGDAGNWESFLDREIAFLERVVQRIQQ